MRAKNKIYELANPVRQDAHSVWLATTLRLSRNFQKYKFPVKLDPERKEQIISLTYERIKECPLVIKPDIYKSGEIGPIEKEFLSEHFLSSDTFHQAHSGEAFITDETGAFLAVINLNEHLQLHLIDTQQDIEKSWNKLIKIEECIGRSLDFAYNNRFGFLTSDSRYCGTGLVITLYLHIPAVIHTGELPELLEKEREEEIEAAGLQGNPNEMIGDILVAHNVCTLGLTEEYILTSLRMWATRAVVAEVSIRKKLKDSQDKNIKNKVARALGLLTHSYQLETIEALNALSLVKLGVELGWIQAPPELNLYKIFFNTRRAHLLNLLEEEVDIPTLPIKRAQYLKRVAEQLSIAL